MGVPSMAAPRLPLRLGVAWSRPWLLGRERLGLRARELGGAATTAVGTWAASAAALPLLPRLCCGDSFAPFRGLVGDLTLSEPLPPLFTAFFLGLAGGEDAMRAPAEAAPSLLCCARRRGDCGETVDEEEAADATPFAAAEATRRCCSFGLEGAVGERTPCGGWPLWEGPLLEGWEGLSTASDWRLGVTWLPRA